MVLIGGGDTQRINTFGRGGFEKGVNKLDG